MPQTFKTLIRDLCGRWDRRPHWIKEGSSFSLMIPRHLMPADLDRALRRYGWQRVTGPIDQRDKYFVTVRRRK